MIHPNTIQELIDYDEITVCPTRQDMVDNEWGNFCLERNLFHVANIRVDDSYRDLMTKIEVIPKVDQPVFKPIWSQPDVPPTERDTCFSPEEELLFAKHSDS